MQKPILIGSNASPFVRRIRILLGERDYEFKVINVMSKEGQEELAKFSHTRRVPVYIEGDKEIFDSTIIASYILDKEFSLDEKLFMKEVDEANDAGILLFQLKVFEMDEKRETILGKSLQGRLTRILTFLDGETRKLSDELGIKEIWLYTFLDWLKFRDVQDWSTFDGLVNFYQKFTDREEIAKTAP
jgi:glutathione S-transferase